MATLAAGKSPLASERVPVLAAREDPRLVPGLLATLEDPPYTAGTSKKFWQAVVAALAATGDPRARDGMDSLSKRYKTINDTHLGGWIAGAMSKAAAAMPPPKPLTAKQEAALVDLEVAILGTSGKPKPKTSPKPTASLEELLARIIAAPDDDDPRLVYADLASEQGDERGELILLQVDRAAGRGTPERSDLERKKFWRKGGLKYLALALSAAADSIELERGFPAKLELSITGLAQVLDAPEWGTVHTLTRAAVGQVTPLLRFLDSDRLPNLVEVESLKAKWIDKLRTPTFPWTRLTIMNDGLKPVHLGRFPKLTHLDIGDAYPVVRRALHAEVFAAAPTLESVTVAMPGDVDATSFAGHPKLQRLVLRARGVADSFAGLPLRELAIVANVPAADAWLRALPTVQTLELDLDDTDWKAATGLFDAHPKLQRLTLARRRGDVMLTRNKKRSLTLTALPTARWDKFYTEMIAAAPALRDGGVTSFIVHPEGPRHRVPPLHADVLTLLRTAWPDLEHRDVL